MSPEAQRIAIAEACNIREIRMSSRWEVTDPPDDPIVLVGIKKGLGWMQVPDYLSDLNAMHTAEQKLTQDQSRWFKNHLVEICGTEAAIHASAPCRAEAFLKSIAKWDYSA